MKKIKGLSLLLCVCLLLHCLFLPVAATETTAQQSDIPAETAVQETAEVPFGSRCIQKGCRTIEGMISLGGTDRKLETAQGVFLYEVGTNTVVYSYNPDLRVHPGSLAKIVLALVVLENCDRDEVVTVTEGIQSYIPAGANSMGEQENEKLKSLEEITVNDLLYGVMLVNANDAAVALAHHVSGTTDAFLTLMNNRVRQMGCVNTEFGNISGLYTMQSYSTARDMAKIVRTAIQNEDFIEIFDATTYTVPATNMAAEREYKTQNYMLDDSTIQEFYDDRVTGGFQTYHETTGASIVCTAESGGLNYIAVILGATRTFEENGWQPKLYGNFNEMEDLLKYGFNNFKVNRIIYEGMTVGQFSASGGECNAVGQVMADVDSVVPINAQMKNLTISFELPKNGLSAPIKAGDQIGTMSISYLNSIMAEAEVYSMGNVRASNDTGVNIRSTAVRSDSDASGAMSVIGTICVIILGLAAAYLAFNAYMRSRMRARRRKRRAQRRRMR